MLYPPSGLTPSAFPTQTQRYPVQGSPSMGGSLLSAMIPGAGMPGPGLGAPPMVQQQDQSASPGTPGIENFLKLLQGLGGMGQPPAASPLGFGMKK